MEKTPLQEISEKYIELSFDRFVEWFGRNRERLTTAERDAIVEAVNETSKNCVNIANNVVQLISPRKIKLFEHSGLEGEQYYETRYGK